MKQFLIAIFIVFVTLVVYAGSKNVYERFRFPLLIPIAVSTGTIIVLLLLVDLPYETYMIGGKWINAFLGPAVVALAYPLYEHRDILKRLAIPIGMGSTVGAVIGIVSGVYMTQWLGYGEMIVYSIAPKSVTAAVAMDVSESLGGVAPLAAVFVMIAGIGGPILSDYIFKLFNINDSVGRGVGLGSASHAIGTTKALESSMLEGSISTVAMIISAVVVSIIMPFIMLIF